MAQSQMLLFKAPGRFLPDESPANKWGDFTVFIEVADDQFAVRQIYLFRNGNSLRYNRAHWCDDYGRLTGLRFSRKPKWAIYYPEAEFVSPAEFEKAWRQAQKSPLWSLQVESSRVPKWGPFRAL